MNERTNTERFVDGEGWEAEAGYSRAVRRGSLIVVSGTTAAAEYAAQHPRDTLGQASDALRRSIEAVEALGGTVADVVRTRVLLAPTADWKEAAQAHGHLFRTIAPANTMVFVGRLIGEHFLVEVEVDALASGEPAT
jgi:enamine deaminase RidA (YjgF/YER057c/UK114 family)